MSTEEYERWEELSDREALGEVLSTEERQELCRHAEQNEVCRAEVDLWRRMSDLCEAGDELGDHRIAQAALRGLERRESGRSVRPQGGDRRRDRRRWVFAVSGAAASLAAAAAAVLWLRTEAPTAGDAADAARLVSVRGEARVDGSKAAVGQATVAGSVLEVVRGVACVETGARIITCASEGSRLRLTEVAGPVRRLDLLEGRVAVALEPQPAGARFSIVARDVWSTAVGTAYSVSTTDSAVETTVYEGKVRVGPSGSERIVPAHRIGLVKGREVMLQPVERPEHTAEWRALEEHVGRRLVPESAPAEPASPSMVLPPTEAPTAARPTAPASPVEAAPAPASPADMLGEARRLMQQHRWPEAAEAYRELRRAFPQSAEAHTVLVPLGQLELERLREPARALGEFGAYLKGGGPLAVEARLGRIRALRALGNAEREESAIAEFLELHPQHLEAAALSERLRVLGTAKTP